MQRIATAVSFMAALVGCSGSQTSQRSKKAQQPTTAELIKAADPRTCVDPTVKLTALAAIARSSGEPLAENALSEVSPEKQLSLLSDVVATHVDKDTSTVSCAATLDAGRPFPVNYTVRPVLSEQDSINVTAAPAEYDQFFGGILLARLILLKSEKQAKF